MAAVQTPVDERDALAPARAEIREKPVSRVETVTPQKAAVWLRANVRNRDLRRHRVLQFAGMISRGEWQVTADGIAFDREGVLSNGQHRLAAIVVADRPVQAVVVRGLAPAAQAVTDQTLTRSLGDTLKLRGESYYFTISGALQWMYRLGYAWETGNVHYSDPGQRPTISQLLTILDENPQLRSYPRRVDQVRRTIKVRAGLFVALWYLFDQVDSAEAEVFAEKLATGEELKRSDPIYSMRLILNNAARDRSRGALPDYREAALLIKAWNAWRENKPITNLTFKYGPLVREPFPRISG